MSKKFSDIFGPGGTFDQVFGEGGTFDRVFGQDRVAAPSKSPKAPEAPEAPEDCTAPPKTPRAKRAKKAKKPKIRGYRHGKNTELEIDLPGRVMSDITIDTVVHDRVLVINVARTSTRKIRKACQLMFALEKHSDPKSVTTALINGVLLVRISAFNEEAAPSYEI